MITIDYALKAIAKNTTLKGRFMHKTRYGRSLDNKYGYDKKSHREEYLRLKDKPFDHRRWW